ncbi:MAG: flagellar hook-length control protein FliK [Asticcacaulis sp.]
MTSVFLSLPELYPTAVPLAAGGQAMGQVSDAVDATTDVNTSDQSALFGQLLESVMAAAGKGPQYGAQQDTPKDTQAETGETTDRSVDAPQGMANFVYIPVIPVPLPSVAPQQTPAHNLTQPEPAISVGDIVSALNIVDQTEDQTVNQTADKPQTPVEAPPASGNATDPASVPDAPASATSAQPLNTAHTHAPTVQTSVTASQLNRPPQETQPQAQPQATPRPQAEAQVQPQNIQAQNPHTQTALRSDLMAQLSPNVQTAPATNTESDTVQGATPVVALRNGNAEAPETVTTAQTVPAKDSGTVFTTAQTAPAANPVNLPPQALSGTIVADNTPDQTNVRFDRAVPTDVLPLTSDAPESASPTTPATAAPQPALTSSAAPTPVAQGAPNQGPAPQELAAQVPLPAAPATQQMDTASQAVLTAETAAVPTPETKHTRSASADASDSRLSLTSERASQSVSASAREPFAEKHAETPVAKPDNSASADAPAPQPQTQGQVQSQTQAQVQTPNPATPTPVELTAKAPLQPALTTGEATPQAPQGTNLSSHTVENIAALSAQITRKLAGKTTQFDMQLTPADQGRVDVRLEIGSDGKLSAHMSFDSPISESEFRGRQDELRRQLEQAGFQLEDGALSFSSRDRQRRDSDRQPVPDMTADNEISAPAAAPLRPYAGASANGVYGDGLYSTGQTLSLSLLV